MHWTPRAVIGPGKETIQSFTQAHRECNSPKQNIEINIQFMSVTILLYTSAPKLFVIVVLLLSIIP